MSTCLDDLVMDEDANAAAPPPTTDEAAQFLDSVDRWAEQQREWGWVDLWTDVMLEWLESPAALAAPDLDFDADAPTVPFDFDF